MKEIYELPTSAQEPPLFQSRRNGKSNEATPKETIIIVATSN